MRGNQLSCITLAKQSTNIRIQYFDFMSTYFHKCVVRTKWVIYVFMLFSFHTNIYHNFVIWSIRICSFTSQSTIIDINEFDMVFSKLSEPEIIQDWNWSQHISLLQIICLVRKQLSISNNNCFLNIIHFHLGFIWLGM